MKKIISLGVITSFLLSAVLIAPVFAENDNSAGNLEKISGPQKLGLYRNIVKKGGNMFGIKKEKKKEEKGQKKEERKASNTKKVLEKIVSLDDVKLFEGIRKVGNELWGYRIGANAGRRIITSGEAACVIAAIEVKDAAIISSNSTFTSGLNAAISTRTTCQKEALASTTTDQIKALNACVSTFKTTHTTLKQTSQKAHQAAWLTYNTSLKSCKASSSSEIKVEDGGGSIAGGDLK